MTTKHLVGAATVAALALPASAGAHVTLQPNSAPQGSFTVENVRVPNEKDNASTVKVELRLPDGFAEASYQATPGWSVKVEKTKLAQPIKTDDGEVTEQVGQITWTANSPADAIRPGQFRDFPLSVRIPGKEGDQLTFKALQRYSDGDIVRWIGSPDSEHPAPIVAVTKTVAGGHAVTARIAAHEEVTSDDSDGASKGLGIAALVVGLLGLIAGGAALVLARKR